jgi:hypothetical protein
LSPGAGFLWSNEVNLLVPCAELAPPANQLTVMMSYEFAMHRSGSLEVALSECIKGKNVKVRK